MSEHASPFNGVRQIVTSYIEPAKPTGPTDNATGEITALLAERKVYQRRASGLFSPTECALQIDKRPAETWPAAMADVDQQLALRGYEEARDGE